MRKVIEIILDIVLFIVLLMFGASMCAKPIVVNTITQDLVGNKTAQHMMDIVMNEFPDVAVDHLEEVQNALADSPALKEITSKYIDEITASIAEKQPFIVPDLNEDIHALIDENTAAIEEHIGTTLDSKKLKEIKDKVADKSNEINAILQNVATSMNLQNSESSSKVLQVYKVITSMQVKVGAAVGIVVLLILIALTKKSFFKTLLDAGMISLLAGISFALVLPNILNNVGTKITDMTLGGHYQVDFSIMRTSGYYMLALGCLLLVIFFIGWTQQKKRYH